MIPCFPCNIVSKWGFIQQYDTLNDLRQRFDEKAKEQDILRSKFDPSALQANLKVAAIQAEEEAEGIADSFLDGK